MKKRLALCAVLVLTGVVGATQAVPPPQLPVGGFYEEFYSDPGFTNMVGWANSECNGGYTREGSVGPYRYLETWNCSTGQITTPCSWWLCDEYEPPGSYYGCQCIG